MGPRRKSAGLVLILSVLLAEFLIALPVSAYQTPCGQPSARAARPPVQMARRPLVAGWSFGKLFSPFRRILGNKRRMIQFATIGMCIGLYIMMRK
jgi:hypothetical protein